MRMILFLILLAGQVFYMSIGDSMQVACDADIRIVRWVDGFYQVACLDTQPAVSDWLICDLGDGRIEYEQADNEYAFSCSGVLYLPLIRG